MASCSDVGNFRPIFHEGRALHVWWMVMWILYGRVLVWVNFVCVFKILFSGEMKVDLFICRSLNRACVFKRFPAYVVWELWKREWRSVENYMSCFFFIFPLFKANCSCLFYVRPFKRSFLMWFFFVYIHWISLVTCYGKNDKTFSVLDMRPNFQEFSIKCLNVNIKQYNTLNPYYYFN